MSYQELKKINKTLNAFERAGQKLVIKSKPVGINVEITTGCNLKCIICKGIPGRDTPPENISERILKRVFPLFPTLDTVSLFGGGEPLIYPYLMDLIREAKKYDVNINLTTNGTLITPKIARGFVLNGVSNLTFSIDSMRKETFEKIRKGAKFEEVIENIKMVRYYKEKYNRKIPKLCITVVAMRCNIEELETFVKLSKNLGIERISVVYLVVYSKELRNESLYFYQRLSDENMLKAEKMAQKEGIELFIPPLFNNGDGKHSPRSICYEPWSYAYISAKGEVFPCCIMGVPFGSLENEDFDTIWNNEKYQALRMDVNHPQCKGPCRDCRGSYNKLNPKNRNSHFAYITEDAKEECCKRR